MDEQLKVGDVVVIKGDESVKMTVAATPHGERVDCIWFRDAILLRDSIPVECLKRI